MEQITRRFADLLSQGSGLVSSMPRERQGFKYWLQGPAVVQYNAWLVSCANLLQVVATPNSHFVAQASVLLEETKQPSGLMTSTVAKMQGLLQSASTEWDAGLLRSIEYIVSAATFDDFLDHAALYHKAGKKTEGAVLASAVFEDTVKKICKKHGVISDGKTVDPLIDDLVAAQVFTPIKAKRAKAYAGVRNHALHAEWDKFDLKDLGQMVQGVRELIEEYL